MEELWKKVEIVDDCMSERTSQLNESDRINGRSMVGGLSLQLSLSLSFSFSRSSSLSLFFFFSVQFKYTFIA